MRMMIVLEVVVEGMEISIVKNTKKKYKKNYLIHKIKL